MAIMARNVRGPTFITAANRAPNPEVIVPVGDIDSSPSMRC